MLTKRRIEVFRCIVDEFIQTAEPIGSKTLVEKYHLPYSSATIRNDMVVLENLGFLEKTHTSSGRIPSTKGYQYYCEFLLKKHQPDDSKLEIATIFADKTLDINEAIRHSCNVISEMTKLASGLLGPDAKEQHLEYIKLFPIDDKNAVCVFITDSGHTENRTFRFDSKVTTNDIEKCCDIINARLKGTSIDQVVNKLQSIKPILAENVIKHELLFNAFISAFTKFASDKVYFAGKSNMLYHPEFADIEKLKSIMSLMEETDIWREIGRDNDMIVTTSNGSKLFWKDDLAIVTNEFNINESETGKLMVVGPSRMDYDKVVNLVDYVSSLIDKIYKGE